MAQDNSSSSVAQRWQRSDTPDKVLKSIVRPLVFPLSVMGRNWRVLIPGVTQSDSCSKSTTLVSILGKDLESNDKAEYHLGSYCNHPA